MFKFKNVFFLFTTTLLSLQLSAQSVTITESGGWFESAWVQWDPIDTAVSYKVYYTGEGITDQRIDDQLIREYPDYYRADIPGLAAGSYTLKIIPVYANSEGTAAETNIITVMAHDRSGFAFSNNRVPGAYKLDGTPKANAVVLYITENTKNTVSLDVTGANANPCVGLLTILEGYKKGDETRPLIVRFIGQVTDPDYLNKGDLVVENDNNASSFITLEGIGEDAVADGWGIRIKNATNIEIRNIGLMNCDSDEGDNIGLQQNNDHIWVHHNDFFYGHAGSDSDQAKGDGALDCKKSNYVTFSYNHFWDSGKSNLLGLGEDTSQDWYITYHHNWYDHSDSRHPRVRTYSAHVYNNYYDGNSKYGVGATMNSSVFVEANYFRNCRYPILTSMQGSDVYDKDSQSNDYSDMPTFSEEDGGTIKAFNNYITEEQRFVAYGDNNYPNATVDFDAYVVNSRDETIPGSVTSAYGSNTYNNFDTDAAVMYDYTADSPEEARNKVIQYAGRINGGDFTWTFNNATDDGSHAVDTDLKNALIGYNTQLIAVQGDTSALGGDTGGGDSGGNDTTDTGGGGEVIPGDEIHNFTTDGLNSSFYTISGNLSDSKGTVSYGELTLTQCLKIESITSIQFTLTEEADLTLVFNGGYSGEIKLDGTSHTISDGILTITLEAGTHEITKDDVANLYYMSITYSSDDIDDGDDGDDNPTSISHNKALEINFYPNPVKTYLMIDTELLVEGIQVYNLTGTKIKSVQGSVQKVDCSDLPAGHYLIMVNARKGVFKQLIMKK